MQFKFDFNGFPLFTIQFTQTAPRNIQTGLVYEKPPADNFISLLHVAENREVKEFIELLFEKQRVNVLARAVLSQTSLFTLYFVYLFLDVLDQFINFPAVTRLILFFILLIWWYFP